VLKKENDQLINEYREINRLKGEAEVLVEKLKVDKVTLENSLEDEKVRFEELLRNKILKEDINVLNLNTDRSQSNTLNLDSERKGVIRSFTLDDDNLDNSLVSK
jgi:hypothetical protein